jgi:hypothetical protein
VILGASLVIVGAAGFRDWFEAMSMYVVGPRTRWNVSLPVLIVRAAGALGYTGVGKPFLIGAPLIGVPLVAYALRRLGRAVREGWILVAAVLLSPICWWHYAPMLLLPAAAHLGAVRLRPAQRAGQGKDE